MKKMFLISLLQLFVLSVFGQLPVRNDAWDLTLPQGTQPLSREEYDRISKESLDSKYVDTKIPFSFYQKDRMFFLLARLNDLMFPRKLETKQKIHNYNLSHLDNVTLLESNIVNKHGNDFLIIHSVKFGDHELSFYSRTNSKLGYMHGRLIFKASDEADAKQYLDQVLANFVLKE